MPLCCTVRLCCDRSGQLHQWVCKIIKKISILSVCLNCLNNPKPFSLEVDSGIVLCVCELPSSQLIFIYTVRYTEHGWFSAQRGHSKNKTKRSKTNNNTDTCTLSEVVFLDTVFACKQVQASRLETSAAFMWRTKQTSPSTRGQVDSRPKGGCWGGGGAFGLLPGERYARRQKKKVCRAQMASVHHHHLNAKHSTLCTLDRIDSLLVLVFSQDLRTIIKTELYPKLSISIVL